MVTLSSLQKTTENLEIHLIDSGSKDSKTRLLLDDLKREYDVIFMGKNKKWHGALQYLKTAPDDYIMISDPDMKPVSDIPKDWPIILETFLKETEYSRAALSFVFPDYPKHEYPESFALFEHENTKLKGRTYKWGHYTYYNTPTASTMQIVKKDELVEGFKISHGEQTRFCYPLSARHLGYYAKWEFKEDYIQNTEWIKNNIKKSRSIGGGGYQPPRSFQKDTGIIAGHGRFPNIFSH